VMRLSPVERHFPYHREASQSPPPEAYENLLGDVLVGDATLFVRADQVMAGWAVAIPIQQAGETNGQRGLCSYPAGSWGPDEVGKLLCQDGRS